MNQIPSEGFCYALTLTLITIVLIIRSSILPDEEPESRILLLEFNV